MEACHWRISAGTMTGWFHDCHETGRLLVEDGLVATPHEHANMDHDLAGTAKVSIFRRIIERSLPMDHEGDFT